MSGHYVKVKVPGKQPIYLEHAKIKGGFVCGYQVNKQGDAVAYPVERMHVIQLFEGVQVVPQIMNNHYCELQDAEGN